MESCVKKAILWQRALRDDGISYTIFSRAQNLPTDLLLYFRMSKGLSCPIESLRSIYSYFFSFKIGSLSIVLSVNLC